MGTWGVGLYSNDTASEVKDICNEIFAFLPVEEGNKVLFNEFKKMLDMNLMDDDYASFWYALSDWQWKHGMLNEEIRDKTLKLLDNYTGISEWELDASKADVNKRRIVLDKLKERILSPQPPFKKPNAKLEKSKHKPGDIIIFKACGKDFEYNPWIKEQLSLPKCYESDVIRNSSIILSEPFNGDNKYYAILCVGTVNKLYSQYIPGVYDEHSIYTLYDYCDSQIPTLQVLSNCGFLPAIKTDYDINSIYYTDIGWTYTFYTSFNFNFVKATDTVDYLNKIHNVQELERFNNLISRKDYVNTPLWFLDLSNVVSCFLNEKMRLSKFNIPIDTLLTATQNPNLLKRVYRGI